MTAPGRRHDPRVRHDGLRAGADTVATAATLQDGTSVLLRRDAGGVVEVARSVAAAPTAVPMAAFRLLGVTSTGQVALSRQPSVAVRMVSSPDGDQRDAVALVGQGPRRVGLHGHQWRKRFTRGGHGRSMHRFRRTRPACSPVDFAGPLPLVRPVALSGAALRSAARHPRAFPNRWIRRSMPPARSRSVP